MDTTHPAATFTATRHELLGAEPLLAAAEIARGVCRSADRTVSVLAITPTRMRRIDGWLGAVGFVTHAAAPDPGRPLLGSVCDRAEAPALLRRILESLVGAVPDHAADAPIELPALTGFAPVSVPDGVAWIVVVSATSIHDDPEHVMFADFDGLLVGDVTAFDRPVRLEPVDVDRVDSRLAELAGASPRSVRDLLLDD